MELRRGAVVDGRYELVAPLGSGGMADVWEVVHIPSGTARALKVLSRPHPMLCERMAREGQLQACIDHPNVVPVIDELEIDGLPALVMALVDGPALDVVIGWGWLSVEDTDAVITGILDGVQAAHDQSIVHRDLKPANVLVSTVDGVWSPRIADFGIAKLDDADPSWRGTLPGVAMGTPEYMAPEQVRDAGSVGPPADIWSLGCLMYELATGSPPFRGPDPSGVLEAVLAGTYAPPSSLRDDLPERWECAIEAALRPRPADRPASCAELWDIWAGHAASPTRVNAPTWSPEALPLPARVPSNLPREADRFIGREEVIGQLLAALEPGARVTVLGPAGVGKTRLVMHALASEVRRWPGGVVFCDLSEADSADRLLAAVAQALDVTITDADPTRRIGAALAARGATLVVLDQVEHLLPWLERPLVAWQAAAHDVSWLWTTRARTGLPGERVVHLSPLSVPPADASEADIRGSEAVRMLVDRARARRASFELTPDDLPAVTQLVHMLDGLPLALELAAARLGVLSPGDLLARLGTPRGSQRRDQLAAALTGAIGSSLRLLEPWEQEAFQQLCVFDGGFDLQAVEAVLDLTPWPEAPPLDEVVRSLLDQSMLVSWVPRRLDGTSSDSSLRFGMLSSLKTYGHDIDSESTARTVTRHAAHYAEVAGLADDHRITAELDNLLAAARNVVGQAPELAAECAMGAAGMLRRRGPCGLGRTLLAETYAACPEGASVRSRLRSAQARVEILEGATARGEALAREALAMAQATGARSFEGWARVVLGRALFDQARLAEAREQLRTAIDVFTSTGDDRGRAAAHAGLANSHRGAGENAEAIPHFQVAIELFEALGEHGDRGVTIGMLGDVLHRQGAIDDAQALFRQALECARRTGNRSDEVRLLDKLGVVKVFRGDIREGVKLLRQALSLARRHATPSALVTELINLSHGLERLGHLQDARACLEEALEVGGASALPAIEGAIVGNLGLLEGREGNQEQALARLRRAWSIYRGAGLAEQADASLLVGRQLMAMTRLDEAQVWLQRAMEGHVEAGARAKAAAVHGSLGDLRLLQGRPAAAAAALAAALQICHEVGLPQVEAEVQATLGCLALARGEPDAAQRHFEAQRALAGELKIPVLRLEAFLGDHLVEGRRALDRVDRLDARRRLGLAREVAANLGEELRPILAFAVVELGDAVAAMARRGRVAG